MPEFRPARRGPLTAWLCVGLGIFSTMSAHAQEGVTFKRTIPAVRVTIPPVIDGDLSDPCWRQAARADRFTDALTSKPVSDQTLAYLAYDDKYIYVAFHCFDSNPAGIVGRETKRGTRFRGEDQVAFSIDPFNTHRFTDRDFFLVNPLGTEFAHLGEGRATKLEWEGAWKAAARIVKDGWTVEMAIPWAILSYPASSKPSTASVNFDREQQRTNTHSWWSNIGQQEYNELDGRWVGVQFPAFKSQISILPYMSPTWTRDKGAVLHSGVDIRDRLSPTLTGVGAINPDFENVEQAVEGIDFSYGERYVRDLRPFFLEGRDVFQSGASAGQYFYSNRIPDFAVGGKLYGKLNPRDTIGAMAAENFGHRTDWLLRGRHEFTATSSVDGALISRDASDVHNRVGVVGENYRTGLWGLDASWAGSLVDTRFTGSVTSTDLYYNDPRWYIDVAPDAVQPGFRDDLGFIPFTGYHGFNSDVGYNADWHKGRIRNFGFFGRLSQEDHYDGSAFNHQRQVFINTQTFHDDGFNIGWSGGRFEQFDDSVYSAGWQAHSSDPFHTYGINYSWGRRAGTPYSFLSPSATWRFGTKLTLGIQSSLQHHAGDLPYQHIFTFNYDFSPERGIVGRVVSAPGGTNAYLAFRRSGYGGVETWLILGDPNAERFKQRIAAKVVWPLSL